MTADELKKITTDALDKLTGLLDEDHSDQLTALLKTMARFHKYSWLCDPQHSQESVYSLTMLSRRRAEKLGPSFVCFLVNIVRPSFRSLAGRNRGWVRQM